MSPITPTLAFVFTKKREASLFAALRTVGRVTVAVSVIGASSLAQARDASICRPSLTISNVRFSETNPETMTRMWTARVWADTSRCASSAGRFEIMFTRQKENGPEIDFIVPFEWVPGAINVSVDFWADEAVEGYQATGIVECPCRR